MRRLPSAKKLAEKVGDGVRAEITGETPTLLPYIGELVQFRHGDPNLVGGPVVKFPFLVTAIWPGGRVNGWVFFDPGMQGMGPDGKPTNLPPMSPVLNAAYSIHDQALTWTRHSKPRLSVPGIFG